MITSRLTEYDASTDQMIHHGFIMSIKKSTGTYVFTSTKENERARLYDDKKERQRNDQKIQRSTSITQCSVTSNSQRYDTLFPATYAINTQKNAMAPSNQIGGRPVFARLSVRTAVSCGGSISGSGRDSWRGRGVGIESSSSASDSVVVAGVEAPEIA